MLDTAMRSVNIIHPGRMSPEKMVEMTTAYFNGSRPDHGNFVANDGGQFAAGLLYRKIRDPFKDYYYIQFYHTEDAYRHLGHTTALVRKMLYKAQSEGVREVSARVQDWNVASWRMLTNRLEFKPHERIYYYLLKEDEVFENTKKAEPYVYQEGDESLLAAVVGDRFINRAERTGGSTLSRDAFVNSLAKYLNNGAEKYVLTDSEKSVVAICEPVRHPYKDFLYVKIYSDDTEKMRELLQKIKTLAKLLDLFEISIRVFCGDINMEQFLVTNGFWLSDTSYAYHF